MLAPSLQGPTLLIRVIVPLIDADNPSTRAACVAQDGLVTGNPMPSFCIPVATVRLRS